MTIFLEIKGIIYNLSLSYVHVSNSLPEHMNRTIVMMVQSMTLDCPDLIPQVLWAVASSTAIHMKNRLSDYIFKLTKLLYKILFDDKPLIKHLYTSRANCNIYIPEKNQIGTSKLSAKRIKCYDVSYTESSKILRLYDPHKR
jgi:hypothetical protein